MMVQWLFNEFWNQKSLFIFILMSQKLGSNVSFDISMSKGATREPTRSAISKNVKSYKFLLLFSPQILCFTTTLHADCPRTLPNASRSHDTWRACAYYFFPRTNMENYLHTFVLKLKNTWSVLCVQKHMDTRLGTRFLIPRRVSICLVHKTRIEFFFLF